MLEIRVKKPEETISINDKEDLKECYLLIVENIQEIVEMFSVCKFLVYYEEDALKNYISKYIFDTINLFIRISENSLCFFEDLGIIDDDCESLIYPLKDSIKKIRKLFYQGKLLTYFKSDNRSFYNYIQRVLLLDPTERKKVSMSIEYSKYLCYKVIMDEEISNSKDFKVKRYITENFCRSFTNTDRTNIPEVITGSDRFLSNNNEDVIMDVSKYFEDKNTISNPGKSDETNMMHTERIQTKSKNNKNFDNNNNKKLGVEEIEFIKNVKIDKDNILDVDSIFEFFFKVLNQTILNDDTKDFYSQNNGKNDNFNRTSNGPLEGSKGANKISFEEKTKINLLDIEEDKEIKFTNPCSPIENFLINALKKSIIKFITNKGFFNIDIILNEDGFRNLNFCKCSKSLNSFLAKCAYCLGNWVLTLCNSLLSINEGLIHKHFSIFSLSYNFNEKNRIYTFNSKFDSSKKNKLRVYDVLFSENWAEEIAKLIICIYKQFYGMKGENGLESFKSEIDQNFCDKTNNKSKIYKRSLSVFMNKFKESVEIITKEFFESYRSVLPNFKSFCKNLGRFPISRYNVIDNLCQHFTNSSIQVLLSKSIMFFLKASDIKRYNKNLKNKINIINLDTPVEPYLINVDKNFSNYLNRKGYFEEFICLSYKNSEDFISEMKRYNAHNEYVKDIVKLNTENEINSLKNQLEKRFKLNMKIKSKLIFI